MKREDGYYWVLFEEEWIIGRYYSNYKSWYLCGFKHEYVDSEIQEINETPIKQESGITQEWIPVSDKKDLKEHDTVLVTNGSFRHTGYLYEGTFHYDVDQATKEDDAMITHWQFLPPNPIS